MEMFLVLVGLHKGMVCHSSLVPFPCVLMLGCTHSYFVVVCCHRDAFSLSFGCHELQYTDVDFSQMSYYENIIYIISIDSVVIV